MDPIPYGLALPLAAAAIVLLVVLLRLRGERSAAAAGRRARRQRRRTSAGPQVGATLDPQSLDEDSSAIEVHECSSALEVAQLLMDSGQDRNAARVLAQFIEANPKQALAPWLKLLEIYRRANARDEYEAVARDLHRHFNLDPQPWEAPRGSLPGGIESYPHVMKEILHRWGSHACHHYLAHLLADNRSGRRSGFSAAALDDILLLIDVLEPQLRRIQAPPRPGPQPAHRIPAHA